MLRFREKVSALLKLRNRSLHHIIKVVYFFLTGLGEMSPLVYHCRDWTSSRLIRNLLKVIVSPLCLFEFFRYRDIPGREELALVLIEKDETAYIEEWLNFHHKQGVSHFIIFDNESADDFHAKLRPYIDAGLVTYRTIKKKVRQCDAYNMAVHDYGHKFRYMGFIDVDEFMFVRNNTHGGGGISNLYEFVDEFMSVHPQAGGLAVNWCIFGSNGHITKPEGGVLENYTMRAEDNYTSNHTFKTICDPMKVWTVVSSHSPMCRKGFRIFSEDGSAALGTSTYDVHFDRIRINHYFTKSREEFIFKKDIRGDVNNLFRDWNDFYRNDQNIIHDTEILSRV